MIKVTETISLDEDEIEESFIRASGPGGQNVNKTSSSVQLRFNARASRNLSNALYLRLAKLAGSRLTKDGVIVLTASGHRSLERNRQDALARLVELIRKASHVPKTRRATKPSRAAKAKRTDKKTQRGAIKKGRGRVTKSDY